MVTRSNAPLVAKLKQAEEAENEVHRLESLAAEAPSLRVELARSQRQENRDLNRKAATAQAQKAVDCAMEKQFEVPGMLETVAKMVYSLYTILKDIDADRREASRYMGIVNRMDYEEDLENSEAEQQEMGRDPSSVEYLVASRHGQARIKTLLGQLDPNFNYLRDCNLDEPLRRDVANFVLAHVVAPETAIQDKLSQDRAIQPPPTVTGVPPTITTAPNTP